MTTEWRTEPKPTVIKWTPRENVCSDFYTECWNMSKSITGELSEEDNLSIPQICPLQLQLGDSLFISSEPSFQSYGMNLVNVSKEEFINCPKASFLQEQLIFVCQIRGLHQVDPNWLGVGTHYFAELHKRGPLLCKSLQNWQVLALLSPICRDFEHTHFVPLNNADAYQEMEIYPNGNIPQVIEDCPFCEELGDLCASQPCLNGGVCQYNQSGYVCNCPSGFLGHNCEIDINECSSRPCQNRGTCIDLPNDVACTCMPIFTGKFCERILNPCELLPCLNNATCIAQQQNYNCRCMPGFTGKNCEEVIDYCRLLSINCLNEGLCLNIIGGFTVSPNASKVQEKREFCEVQIDNCGSNSCENGGTYIGYEDHFECTCPIGFEGERCELDIDACLFNNISCAPGALCMDKSHGFNYTCLSPCIGNTEALPWSLQGLTLAISVSTLELAGICQAWEQLLAEKVKTRNHLYSNSPPTLHYQTHPHHYQDLTIQTQYRAFAILIFRIFPKIIMTKRMKYRLDE
ncbi:EGF-like-domain, multiple 11 [Turdus rufiventris]|nr:EGF-like-domain, multiple 11 [Turdus rufiventris]